MLGAGLVAKKACELGLEVSLHCHNYFSAQHAFGNFGILTG
jgi:hypothetical protein